MSANEKIPQATAEFEERNIEARLYTINHIFLPPELPQENDGSDIHEWFLTEDVRIALQRFRTAFGDASGSDTIDRCIELIKRMQRVRDRGGFLEGKMLLSELERLGQNDILAIHMRAQNAGLLIVRVDEEYQFQSMELLVRDDDVMKCKGRLRRQFPGPAISIEAQHMNDERFRKAIVHFLTTVDRETDWSNLPKDAKDDERCKPDTADPRLVTGMLMGVLRGFGRRCAVSGITKRSREEVFLGEEAQTPWRRSGLWLMIRVSLQLCMLNPGSRQLSSLYKEFMIFFMSYVLRESPALHLPHDLLFFMTTKISRRILKLGSTPNGPGFAVERPGVAYAQHVLEDVHKTLKDEWARVQSKAKTLNLSALESLQFEEDTKLQLPELRQYLDGVTQLLGPKSDVPELKVSAGHSFQRNTVESGALQFFPRSNFTADKDFVYFELADFEDSVESFLGTYEIA
ncbi:uncharacterized protein BDZ99DRAFT_526870 [Mytilinidion resinicola]|uniref:DUF6606 domain-containing protein n=1 Tax=Mytilinidion resinicola TaxID=574789 RepID=A0A6A6Y2S9_9PEZI|nr:uncharacterized protein BDZ99DRAFT_526870 [Mytilinidion resinicola]KAF2803121.1 hypothetical protein BDZ99DRAFT_526870 [Mytilinidion resinicola]